MSNAAEIARASLLSKRVRHDSWNARLSRLSSTGTKRSTPLAPSIPRLIRLEMIHWPQDMPVANSVIARSKSIFSPQVKRSTAA